MKRKHLLSTITAIAALLLFTPSSSNAQIQEFKNWVANPKGELAQQRFANKALSKADCDEAAFIIDSLWLKESAKELGRQWERLTIANDSIKLACACRVFGMTPKDGRSLYISMHGGGHCPKEVNDEQWMNQIYLYEPFEGVYIAPRAPWNTSDLWHRKGLDEMAQNAERGRSNITTSLALLEKTKEDKPMSVLPQLFTEIKKDELLGIYSKGTTKEKEEVVRILSLVNPSYISDWEELKKQ